MTNITGPGVLHATNPGWGPSHYDDLLLPNGKRVGETESGELYRTFDRLKVPGFDHHLGRIAAIEKFAAEVARVAQKGADEAVARWFKEHA